MRVLIFGDSITQGMWDPAGGWVAYVRRHYDERMLANIGANDEPVIFNLGVSADSSRRIAARIVSETTARTNSSTLPVIIVQVGVNDASVQHGTVFVAPEEYRDNLKTIIKLTSNLCSKLIFVGSTAVDEHKTTPVSWGHYVYKNEAIKQYEDIMADVAATSNLPFIPIFDEFMGQLQTDATLLADGLHPTAKGHQIMSEIIAPKLIDLLAQE